MKGQELEDLRIQMDLNIDDFSRMIGISALDYSAYVEKSTIENLNVVVKVHELELRAEEENIGRYMEILRAQPTGPFSAGKILAHIEEIGKLKKDPAQTPPITVEWHLSNRCDHDCPFCTFRESVRHSPNASIVFPDNLVEPLVEDLKEMGAKAVVYSGGGEPLLSPSAMRAMSLVKAAGMKQGLITNGSKIGNQEIAEVIVDSCSWVRVSVDAASQGTYELVHGKKRNLEQTIANVKTLVAIRNAKKSHTQIGVSFLLTMLNYADLLPAAKLFKDIGVDYFQVKPIVISAEERLVSGNIFWRRGIFNQLVALPDQAAGTKYKVYTLGFKFADMMSANDKKGFRKCYGFPFYPVVTATGEIYVCCLMIGNEDLCYGTIGESKRFKELWGTSQMVQIGESVKVRDCPINCKLSETNKALEIILGKRYEDPEFLN